MKKLTKQEIVDRDAICSKLRDAREQVDTALTEFNTKRGEAYTALAAAVEAFNDTQTEEWDKVSQAIADYNEVVTEADQWKTDVASQIDEYMSERSEKWQEGDRAQAYTDWKSAFEDASIEEMSVEEPDQIEIEEPQELSVEDLEDAADQLEQMPEEVAE